MRKRYDILHRIFEENKRKSKKFVEIQFVVVGSVFRHNAIHAVSEKIWNFRLSLPRYNFVAPLNDKRKNKSQIFHTSFRGNEVTVGIQRSENEASP